MHSGGSIAGSGSLRRLLRNQGRYDIRLPPNVCCNVGPPFGGWPVRGTAEIESPSASCSHARMRSLAPVLVAAPPRRARPDLTTVAERSAFHRTGRYEEVERLCAGFQTAYPGRARCFTFGRSPEGRPLLALAASEDGVLDPALAGRRSRPVILFEGGIHAGEI